MTTIERKMLSWLNRRQYDRQQYHRMMRFVEEGGQVRIKTAPARTGRMPWWLRPNRIEQAVFWWLISREHADIGRRHPPKQSAIDYKTGYRIVRRSRWPWGRRWKSVKTQA